MYRNHRRSESNADPERGSEDESWAQTEREEAGVGKTEKEKQKEVTR